jgi:Zn-dependent peptidase ImmA (M78 family)
MDMDRSAVLNVARIASQVLDDVNARARILERGYTRIDPIEIAEHAGVPVMSREMDKLLGAFLREDDQAGIILNLKRPPGMMHMTCAHELGHFYMGHSTQTDERIDYGKNASIHEREADQFAYQLMSPQWLLAHVMKMHRWNTKAAIHDEVIVYQLSLRLGISYKAAVWSLFRRNLLDGDTAQNMAGYEPIQIKRRLAPESADLGERDIWVLAPQDKDCVLEPRPKDRFLMALPSHAAAGYLWALDEVADMGFTLRPALVDGAAEPDDDASTPIGGANLDSYSLEASHAIEQDPPAGPINLKFSESQPWRSRGPTDASFALDAQFERIGPGLSAGSRDRHVQKFLPS